MIEKVLAIFDSRYQGIKK